MICKSCGNEVSETRRTCPKCGMPLVDYSLKPKPDEEKTITDYRKRNKDLEEEAERHKEKVKEKLKKLKEENEEKSFEFIFGVNDDDRYGGRNRRTSGGG